ncbi:hypothetical protein SKAU_G00017860 [Synaphobranchus kaupii]|uniref:Uncharacterized protein n=1 Tax=Synaphobranchus kaupii TaxID=118154 RepID=A0A9Q1GCA1_SYNKA|nr:hypothetical protein SKAU_G00017860 [Synaphobranchus kaupii]
MENSTSEVTEHHTLVSDRGREFPAVGWEYAMATAPALSWLCPPTPARALLGGVMSDIGPHCAAPSPASPLPALSPPPHWGGSAQTQPHQPPPAGGLQALWPHHTGISESLQSKIQT